HEDLRRARSATMSMIPTKTGAAAAVGLVLPELNGKLDGFAIRVPTINVSIVDLSFVAKRETTVEEVNSILKAASEGELKGILDYNTEPLVSVDFNHNPASSTYDSTLTKVSGKLVKVSSWYDNEWGFFNRMLGTTDALMSANEAAWPRSIPCPRWPRPARCTASGCSSAPTSTCRSTTPARSAKTPASAPRCPASAWRSTAARRSWSRPTWAVPPRAC